LDDFAGLVHTVTRAFDNIGARIIELSSRTRSMGDRERRGYWVYTIIDDADLYGVWV
jgi:hypothetical protein